MAYSKEEKTKIIDEICRLMAEEGLSLRKAIPKEGSINRDTFYSWIDKDQKKADQYARAIEERADYLAEEILELADTQNADGYVEKETGKLVIDGTVIQRSRLQVDTRKWLMSKMFPKKYGDKLQTDNKTEHTGEVRIIREVKK